MALRDPFLLCIVAGPLLCPYEGVAGPLPRFEVLQTGELVMDTITEVLASSCDREATEPPCELFGNNEEYRGAGPER